MTDLLLECFVEDGRRLDIRPAPHRRGWMDETNEASAYRCLPLAIANAHGWEILNPARFAASWTGGARKEDVIVTQQGENAPLATSHFAHGILTFHVPCLFRTPPGYDLWIMGPVNRFKAHIQALSAVVETDWSPFGFTMNWQFTTPGSTIAFDEGEPFVSLFPLPRGLVERFTPVFRSPDDDPDLWGAYTEWLRSRRDFLKDLRIEGSDARRQKWQKHYFGGPEEAVEPAHRTKLRLKPFERKSRR
jgi:Family of unknown function (DUF6065)